MEPFDEDKAYCSIQAINGVLMAMIAAHPNRALLAQELRKGADNAEALLLDTPNADHIIETIQKQITSFAKLAEAEA